MVEESPPGPWGKFSGTSGSTNKGSVVCDREPVIRMGSCPPPTLFPSPHPPPHAAPRTRGHLTWAGRPGPTSFQCALELALEPELEPELEELASAPALDYEVNKPVDSSFSVHLANQTASSATPDRRPPTPSFPDTKCKEKRGK